MKHLYGWSNTLSNSLLNLLVEALHEGNMLPDSTYDYQKIIKDLGLDYVKTDVCIDDCILYKGGYKNLDEYPICKKTRLQENKKKNNVPNNTVRCFPIKPRLQKLFRSKQVM